MDPKGTSARSPGQIRQYDFPNRDFGLAAPQLPKKRLTTPESKRRTGFLFFRE